MSIQEQQPIMAGKSKATLSDRDRAGASGIPLQRHLAELVTKTSDTNGQRWRVEAEEVPAGGGFLDMVLYWRGLGDAPIRMAVEVKRFYDVEEERPMRLLFLAPRRASRSDNSGPILPYRDASRTADQDLPHRLLAGEFQATLQCPVAEHCIFEERKGNAGMDAIARELLEQMQALSLEAAAHGRYAFVPVVVTNAELRLLRLGDVDLSTGVLAGGDEGGAPHKWLRYEKTLSQSGYEPGASRSAIDFAEWAAERVRTVYIVRSAHFVDFLSQFQLGGEPWNRRQ